MSSRGGASAYSHLDTIQRSDCIAVLYRRPSHLARSLLMKAAVYYENGGPEVLKYEDVPDPTCAPDGVVVDVEVISVEGGDTLHRSRTPFTDRPHIVGYQCAGTVREVGRDATGFAV